MSSGWIAAGMVASSAIGGVMSSRAGKKQTSAQRDAQNAQLQLMREQMDNFQKLINDLPEQERGFIKDITSTYADLNLMLSEAKRVGDEKSEAIFQAQRDLVDSHFDAEMEAIDVNKNQILSSIRNLSSEAVALVRADADANDLIKAAYRKEADVAVGNLRKMADASGKRMDAIIETGMSPEAAAQISKTRQGVADIARKANELEAAVGKGGSASRLTAVDLEGLKLIGEQVASARREARWELKTGATLQAGLQQAAEDRAIVLEQTRGRQELAARQPFMQAELATEHLAGQQGLTALGNRNVETRRLTGAEGESSLAREQEFARDRMSLLQGQAAAEQAAKERTQELTFQGTAQTAGAARSMADVLGVQAQNFANMADQSRSQSQDAFTQAATFGIGAVAGYQGAIPGVEKGSRNAALQGALFTGFGIQPKGLIKLMNPWMQISTGGSK